MSPKFSQHRICDEREEPGRAVGADLLQADDGAAVQMLARDRDGADRPGNERHLDPAESRAAPVGAKNEVSECDATHGEPHRGRLAPPEKNRVFR